MDRVRLCRDEFLKCIYAKKRHFIDTLDACVHPLIQFCRNMHKACVVVSLRSIVTLHVILRNVETIS